MSGASNYLAAELGDHVLGQGARNYTPPTSVELRLFLTPPLDDGTGGVEASYQGYLRQVTGAAGWFPATLNGVVSNALVVQFPLATGPEAGPVTHLGLYDQLANLLFVHPLLDQTLEIVAGHTPLFSQGDIRLDWNANTIGLSRYLAAKLGDHVMGMGTRDFAPPPSIYAAGWTTAPDDAESMGVEANYGGYARVLTPAATWGLADSLGKITNSGAEVLWPLATSDEGQDWAEVALHDALTGGNLLLHGPPDDTTIEPETGDRPVLRVGKFALDWNAN